MCAQSAGAVEYTDCFSAQGLDTTKQVAESVGALEYTGCFPAEE